MDFKQLCEARYSVRAYLAKEVEDEKIKYILECAQLAPSAHNNQPWLFFVIKDDATKIKVQEAYDREWFKSAPAYLVVCKDKSQSWKRESYDNKDFDDVDASIACEHIVLTATSIGLGTCWVCNFNPDMISNVLNLEEHQEAIAILPLGYIDKKRSKLPEKKRKSISEITRWI